MQSEILQKTRWGFGSNKTLLKLSFTDVHYMYTTQVLVFHLNTICHVPNYANDTAKRPYSEYVYPFHVIKTHFIFFSLI